MAKSEAVPDCLTVGLTHEFLGLVLGGASNDCRRCGAELGPNATQRAQRGRLVAALAPVSAVNPAHYRAHPSGVECIRITEHFNFNLGNAIKYVWRAGLKGQALEDLKKARWYLDREIARIESETVTTGE